MRRVKLFAALSLLSTGALLFALVGRSGAGPDFDVVNGTVTAGGDHISAGNDAFPNFATGAIDNRYPLASAHVDNSSSQGYGSPIDTGPLGQTGAATAGVQQPQYASAKYPPKATSVTVGSPPVLYSTAHAAENTASSDSAVARISTVPAAAARARAASIDRLDRALADWRHEFLTADDNARYPFVAGKASDPDGAQGLTALTTSNFDPKAGLLSVDADAHIEHASFGGGAIALDDVHLDVSITNNGTPTPKITIDIGGASVGGVPVTIGTEGVSVAGTAVPGTSGVIDQANAGLQQALASGGFTIAAVQPVITKGNNQVSIEATAVRVRFEGGDVAPGVPGSFVENDIGEAFAFSLAVPSNAVPSAGPTAVGGLTNNAPTTSFIPGSPGSPGSPGTPTSSSGGSYAMPESAQARKAVANKPLWLLLLYFAWQSSIVGSAAALWLWRADPA